MNGPSIQDTVEQMSKLINGEGGPCNFGCDESEVDAIVAYCSEVMIKPYCLVTDWCWADLDVSRDDAETLARSGVKPSFIYASNIIADEAQRWRPGMPVKTTLLTDFQKNCIFVTANTAYVLVGPGKRLRVVPSVYTNLTLE